METTAVMMMTMMINFLGNLVSFPSCHLWMELKVKAWGHMPEHKRKAKFMQKMNDDDSRSRLVVKGWIFYDKRWSCWIIESVPSHAWDCFTSSPLERIGVVSVNVERRLWNWVFPNDVRVDGYIIFRLFVRLSRSLYSIPMVSMSTST